MFTLNPHYTNDIIFYNAIQICLIYNLIKPCYFNNKGMEMYRHNRIYLADMCEWKNQDLNAGPGQV